MLSVLPLWITLNAYAFLLDALAVAGTTGAWFLFSSNHPVLGWIVAIITAIILFCAIQVHISYPTKLKTYHILYRRNHKKFHRNSFHEFMTAPCYRLVVRTVLCHVGHSEEYNAIFKDVWGEGITCCRPIPATVIIFKTPEEGRRWLEEQQKVFVDTDDDNDDDNSAE